MNKLIKDLTSLELHDLVKQHLYHDLAPVHGMGATFVSEAHKIVVSILAQRRHTKVLAISKAHYYDLMKWGEAAGREQLFIFSTPLGIWEFNFELLTPEYRGDWVEFSVDLGEPILAWYPLFDSEEEWVEAAMEEMSESNYVDPNELDLEDMMEELLSYEGNLEYYTEDAES
jgi:hypothetical protein